MADFQASHGIGRNVRRGETGELVVYADRMKRTETKGKTPMLAIDEVEEYLIGNAASRNAELANKRRLPNQKWSIANVTQATKGAPPATVVDFKKLMGMQ